jgi:prevent-host-death family protein
MHVGIRDFKSRLSHYLAKVRSGEEVIVTDRGVPVARVEPLSSTSLPPAMQELIRTGRMTYRGPLRYFPTRARMSPGEQSSTDLIREQRR